MTAGYITADPAAWKDAKESYDWALHALSNAGHSPLNADDRELFGEFDTAQIELLSLAAPTLAAVADKLLVVLSTEYSQHDVEAQPKQKCLGEVLKFSKLTPTQIQIKAAQRTSAWHQAIANILATKAELDLIGNQKVTPEIHQLVQQHEDARRSVLALSSATLSDIAEKLEILWDEELWDERDPYSGPRQRILGDLRRLEHEACEDDEGE